MSEYSRRIVILVVVAVVSLACLCLCCVAAGVVGFEAYGNRLLTVTPSVGTPRPVGTRLPLTPPSLHRGPPAPARSTPSNQPGQPTSAASGGDQHRP
jgi:hypothetical protein